MTPQPLTTTVTLCPHLAAAALWMTKPPRRPLRGKVGLAGSYRAATDDLAAL